MATNTNGLTVPALFADFDLTIQDTGDRPLRAISVEEGDGGIPTEVVELVQSLYDQGQKLTVSFKDGKPYFGKQGESAAIMFTNDAKDSTSHITARAEHTNGVTVLATRDGIVVTVTVGKKRGRTVGTTEKTDSKK
jgi:hypothetical protein